MLARVRQQEPQADQACASQHRAARPPAVGARGYAKDKLVVDIETVSIEEAFIGKSRTKRHTPKAIQLYCTVSTEINHTFDLALSTRPHSRPPRDARILHANAREHTLDWCTVSRLTRGSPSQSQPVTPHARSRQPHVRPGSPHKQINSELCLPRTSISVPPAAHALLSRQATRRARRLRGPSGLVAYPCAPSMPPVYEY